MEAFLELVKLAFLLVKILDKSATSLLHLMEAAFKAFDDSYHWPVDLPSVLRMPDVMSNELLNGSLPSFLEHTLVVHNLKLVHQTVYVLDEDVITSDKNFLLLLSLGSRLLLLGCCSCGILLWASRARLMGLRRTLVHLLRSTLSRVCMGRGTVSSLWSGTLSRSTCTAAILLTIHLLWSFLINSILHASLNSIQTHRALPLLI